MYFLQIALINSDMYNFFYLICSHLRNQGEIEIILIGNFNYYYSQYP